MKQVPDETIKEIADWLESGFRVFLHRKTFTLITYPDEGRSASFEPSQWRAEMQAVRKQWDNYLEIEGMEPQDSFRVLQDFTDTIIDTSVKNRLLNALQQKRPFSHFKARLDRSGAYREQWFRFREERMIEWVQDQLKAVP